MEDTFKYILYLSDFIWIFPVLRQRKTKFFVFFLMFALMGPIGYLFFFLISPNMYFPTITLSYIAFLSFFDTNFLKKKWEVLFLLYIIFVIPYFYTNDWHYYLVMLVIVHASLILMISHRFVLELLEKKFNYFIIVIITLFLLINYRKRR